ncbi:FAD-dependent oxidoreductase [Amorphus orientalis]|uniref:Ferredoxin--NADP+ reductase n=1 Tax=Amorphus orientalis TaxID=649198 RepID=A0AAE3VPI0_9HYPH|nr:FAD-dependent oxidoreductase [Amorphus orientalis]MDQ0315366.1 ferredoxin--NADP+ reductase [Amorphus orientalis]
MTVQIAIVGAGPSGCYLAQALGKLRDDIHIDLIDRLPVPYGLVRYGVAPDHQGTKGVVRQFARLFEKQGVGFVGNLRIGDPEHDADLTLAELREFYDVVVLATGLSADRKLGIPGEELDGIFRAGFLTRHWNDHPDEAGRIPGLGRNVVIVGNGNVAIDILRILAKTPHEFEGSDLADTHTQRLSEAGLQTIDIVGRSPADAARFDPVMIRELGKLSATRFVVEDLPPAEDGEDKRLAALRELGEAGASDADKTVTFRFGWVPERATGADGTVSEAHFHKAGGGEELVIACDTLITAIGFDDDRAMDREALLSRAVDAEAGAVEPGLYLAGWFKRGPRGTIPENRADAQELAKRIAADLEAHPPAGDRPGATAIRARFDTVTDYEGWLRIDEAETADVPDGRCRRKLTLVEDMLAAAGAKRETR